MNHTILKTVFGALVANAAAAALAAFIVVGLTSCTENSRARTMGGTATIELPKNTELVNVTWKETQLWYLTRPMRADETPETLTFKEKSSLGIVEGTVLFKESR